MPCKHGVHNQQHCDICSREHQIQPAPHAPGVPPTAAAAAESQQQMTEEEVESRIVSKCLQNSEIRRRILDALKTPGIDDPTFEPELKTLLNTWQGYKKNSAELRSRIKIRMESPRPSRSAKGTEFAGNVGGICQKISLTWGFQASQTSSSGSVKPKTQFYQHSSKESLGLPVPSDPTIWTERWMRSMDPLLPPRCREKGFFWTCESVFPENTIFAILSSPMAHLFHLLAGITKQLDQIRQNGFLIITSFTINHTIAGSIKPRPHHVSVRLFDPNSIQGELAITLSKDEVVKSSWEGRFQKLRNAAGFNSTSYPTIMDPYCDVTVFCILDHQHQVETILDLEGYIDTFHPILRMRCLIQTLRSIGGRAGSYYQHALVLFGTGTMLDWNVRVYDGSTPLYIASEHGHEGVVDRFLTFLGTPQGSDCATQILAAMPGGATPLYISSHHGHEGVVDRFLTFLGTSQGSRYATQILAAMPGGATPLYISSHHGHEDVVNRFLTFLGTPQGSYYAVQILAAMPDGATPLSTASYHGHEGVVGRFLMFLGTLQGSDYAAKILAARLNGTTPLCFASEYGHEGVVGRFLTFLGTLQGSPYAKQILAAKPNGATPFYIASEHGHEGVVDRFLTFLSTPRDGHDAAQILAAMPGGATPFYIASQNGHEGVVGRFLTFLGTPQGSHYAAKILAAKPGGATPLRTAIENKHVGVVRTIVHSIKKFPNEIKRIILQDSSGWSPLQFAQHYMQTNTEIIARLQELKP